MSTTRRLWCALAVLLLPRLALSQIPVIDASNLFANTTTSLQSTISAVENVAQAAMALENLVPLDDILTAQGIAEDVAALADIVAQAEGLSYDVQQLQAQITALFDLDTAPASPSALQVRLQEIHQVRWQATAYAMRVQSLMQTAIRTANHVTTLANSIAALLGNKQALQTLSQQTAMLNQTALLHATQSAAADRAGSLKDLEELLVQESVQRINADILSDMPRR